MRGLLHGLAGAGALARIEIENQFLGVDFRKEGFPIGNHLAPVAAPCADEILRRHAPGAHREDIGLQVLLGVDRFWRRHHATTTPAMATTRQHACQNGKLNPAVGDAAQNLRFQHVPLQIGNQAPELDVAFAETGIIRLPQIAGDLVVSAAHTRRDALQRGDGDRLEAGIPGRCKALHFLAGLEPRDHARAQADFIEPRGGAGGSRRCGLLREGAGSIAAFDENPDIRLHPLLHDKRIHQVREVAGGCQHRRKGRHATQLAGAQAPVKVHDIAPGHEFGGKATRNRVARLARCHVVQPVTHAAIIRAQFHAQAGAGMGIGERQAVAFVVDQVALADMQRHGHAARAHLAEAERPHADDGIAALHGGAKGKRHFGQEVAFLLDVGMGGPFVPEILGDLVVLRRAGIKAHREIGADDMAGQHIKRAGADP